MENFNETVGRQVRMHREANSMQQAELAAAARELGLPWSQAVVSKVERGERPLRFEEAVEVAGILGVPLAYLSGAADARTAVRRELGVWKKRVDLEEWSLRQSKVALGMAPVLLAAADKLGAEPRAVVALPLTFDHMVDLVAQIMRETKAGFGNDWCRETAEFFDGTIRAEYDLECLEQDVNLTVEGDMELLMQLFRVHYPNLTFELPQDPAGEEFPD